MAVGGLGAGDVQAIRDGLASGRRPRVEFTASAGQIAGQVGHVVALTDPGASDDWLVVRFGKDELPFSPTDLRVLPRGAAARAAKPAPAARKAAEPAPRPEPEFMIDKPVTRPGRGAGRSPAGAAGGRAGSGSAGASNGARTVPGGARAVPGESNPRPAVPGASSLTPAVPGASSLTPTVPGATDDPAGNGSAKDAGNGSAKDAGDRMAKGDSVAKDAAKPVADSAAPSASNPPASARRSGARAGKAKAPAGLTVTLAYADGEWTVAAQQGTKVLARPYEVRPLEALRIVSLVDVPGVREAVRQILSAERAEAQERADKLRAELAELEERLADLRDAG